MATPEFQLLPGDTRTSIRQRALRGATLATASGERRANILNLSTGGALLDASEPPTLGEPVTLRRDMLVAPGRVTWINGHRFGIAFDRAIDDADVERIVDKPLE